MAFNFNPVLSEIQGHIQSMSPDAQAVVAKIGGNSQPTTSAITAAQAPSVIPHGMLLPHPGAGPEPAPISMGSTTPSLSTPALPSAAPQLVTGPKRGQEMMTTGQQVHQGTLLGDQTELSRSLDQGAGVNSIAHRIEGAMPNHPLLGKILGWGAQVPAMLADTAVESASPIARMALSNVPGTYAHQAMTLGHERGQVAQDEANAQKQAQTAAENATAQHTAAETPEIAPNAESTRGLQGAQKANLESETNIRENPPEVWKALTGMVGPNGEPVEYEERSGQTRLGNVTGVQPTKQPKPDSPEQQYIDEFQRTHKGASIAQAERQYTLDTQRPPQIAPIMMMVPNANGGSTATVVRPGSNIAPGAQTAAGLNSVNTPTMTQRTAAGRAQTVIGMAPEVLARIDATASQMGPVSGRWNEFMQGKVGAPNQAMSELRSDLLMMSSAVALAHAQGRLPENLREEFDRAINAPKQTPANLKGTIQTMLPWLQKVQEQGHSSAATNGGAAQTQPKANDPLGIR